MASSLATLACGGWEIGLGFGLFTEAELAAADLLVQLSGGGGEASSSSSMSSPRSVNTYTGAASWEVKEQDATAIAAGLAVVEEELDRRARKRFRLLSDLYVATRPVTEATISARKRKRHHEAEAEPAMARYGDQRCYQSTSIKFERRNGRWDEGLV